MARWKNRPQGSNWGDFGQDDQLGRVNLLTSEQVLKGMREVTEGKVFCLSLPLNLPGGNILNPRRKPPRLSPTALEGVPYMNFPMENVDQDSIDVLSDDQVVLSLQYSTQWDSLAHVGAQFDVGGDGQLAHVYYNGYRAGTDVVGPACSHATGDTTFDSTSSNIDAANNDGNQSTTSSTSDDSADNKPSGNALGAKKLGIENFAVHGMQGRGVLVDLARHFGTGRTLVGYNELMAALKADSISIEPGDMLVLRTGFAEALIAMGGTPDADTLARTGAVLDGTDQRLLDWITESGIATLCADNYAVEAYPARDRTGKKSLLPLHHHCLFKLGLPLAELWYLRDLADWLAQAGRHRFLLTAPPLRLPGAVGSPVTPIATV